MRSVFAKYAFFGGALRRAAKGPVERNLDRIGKGALLTLPVAAGVVTAKKMHKGFEPDANAASFGIQRVE